MEDKQIKEILSRENAEFERLDKRHRECEQKLVAITAGNIKTDREWLEEHNLKKEKLKLKDSMQRFISAYRKQVSH